MTVTNKSNNISKKDIINANASTSFKELKDFETVTGAFIADDVDAKTGEPITIGYIIAESGVYAGSSENVVASIEDVIDLLNDGESVRAKVITRQSNNGRDFCSLRVE